MQPCVSSCLGLNFTAAAVSQLSPLLCTSSLHLFFVMKTAAHDYVMQMTTCDDQVMQQLSQCHAETRLYNNIVGASGYCTDKHGLQPIPHSS